MGIKGFIFFSLTIIGAGVNYISHIISDKTGIPELKIKLAGFFTAAISIALFFIFGK